jgi:hypothetical protein
VPNARTSRSGVPAAGDQPGASYAAFVTMLSIASCSLLRLIVTTSLPVSRSNPAMTNMCMAQGRAADTAVDSIGRENIGKSYAIALSCSSAEVAAVQSVSVMTR